MKIVIPMTPKPKGRPRFYNGHAYTPAETRGYERVIQLYSRLAVKEPLTGAVRLDISFYLPIPQSWSKPKKERATQGC